MMSEMWASTSLPSCPDTLSVMEDLGEMQGQLIMKKMKDLMMNIFYSFVQVQKGL